MSEAGAEPGRYVGADAAVLEPVELGSAAERGHDFEQSAGPALAAAAAGVAAAGPDVKGGRELAGEVALATAASETASKAFGFACTDGMASVGKGEHQPVDASACVGAKTSDDHLA